MHLKLWRTYLNILKQVWDTSELECNVFASLNSTMIMTRPDRYAPAKSNLHLKNCVKCFKLLFVSGLNLGEGLRIRPGMCMVNISMSHSTKNPTFKKQLSRVYIELFHLPLIRLLKLIRDNCDLWMHKIDSHVQKSYHY